MERSGSQKERLELRIGLIADEEQASEDDPPFHVLLSTYNIVTGAKDDRAFLRRYALDCLILDEGHLMKNAASQRYHHLMRLRVRAPCWRSTTPRRATHPASGFARARVPAHRHGRGSC